MNVKGRCGGAWRAGKKVPSTHSLQEMDVLGWSLVLKGVPGPLAFERISVNRESSMVIVILRLGKSYDPIR